MQLTSAHATSELKSHLRNTTSQKLNFLPHLPFPPLPLEHVNDPQHMPQIIKFLQAKLREIKERQLRLDKLQFRCNTCKLLKFCPRAATVMATPAITVSPCATANLLLPGTSGSIFTLTL